MFGFILVQMQARNYGIAHTFIWLKLPFASKSSYRN